MKRKVLFVLLAMLFTVTLLTVSAEAAAPPAVRGDSATVNGRDVTTWATVTASGASSYFPTQLGVWIRNQSNTWMEFVELPAVPLGSTKYRTGTRHSITIRIPAHVSGPLVLRWQIYNDWFEWVQDRDTLSVYIPAPTITPTEVTLNRSSLDLIVGQTGNLSATVRPADATDRSVHWSSDNPSVATVNNNGVVTARAAGRATITVTTNSGSRRAQAIVNVANIQQVQPRIISFDTQAHNITVGDTLSFIGQAENFQSWQIWWLRNGAVASPATSIQHGSAIQFQAGVNSVEYDGAVLRVFSEPNGRGEQAERTTRFSVVQRPTIRITEPSATQRIYVGQSVWLRGFYAYTDYITVNFQGRTFTSRPGGGVYTGIDERGNNYFAVQLTATIAGTHLITVDAESSNGLRAVDTLRLEAHDVPVNNDNATVFSQTDARWRNIRYAVPGESWTIGTSGCGLLALTNAVYNLNGQFIPPAELATFAMANEHRNPSPGGTRHSLYSAANGFPAVRGAHYGFKFDGTITRAGNNRALQTHLQNGGTAVASITGHIIAIVDYCPSRGFLALCSAPGGNNGLSAARVRMTAQQLINRGWGSTFLISKAPQVQVRTQTIDEIEDFDEIDSFYNTGLFNGGGLAIGGVILTAHDSSGRPGERVAFVIDSSQPTHGRQLTVNFNAAKLRVTEVITGSTLSSYSVTDGSVKIASVRDESLSDCRIIIYFEIVCDIPGLIPITITDVILDANAGDAQVINGSITVLGQQTRVAPGSVLGHERPGIMDVLAILDYIVGAREFTPEQIEIATALTGDGININSVIVLLNILVE